MEVKEPMRTYNAMPSTPVMRGRLIKALENEEDSSFIQNMYVLMTQLKMEKENVAKPKYSLSSLDGILSQGGKTELSYDDMRQTYLKDKYSI